MEGSLVDLSKYRLSTAKSDLNAAKVLYSAKEFRGAVNRSYYAIFHALRAVLAMDDFDSSKHSGIIAYFNQHYVKTEVFEKSVSKLVSAAFRLREKADYQDFYIVSVQETEGQIAAAEQLIEMIEQYLAERWECVEE